MMYGRKRSISSSTHNIFVLVCIVLLFDSFNERFYSNNIVQKSSCTHQNYLTTKRFLDYCLTQQQYLAMSCPLHQTIISDREASRNRFELRFCWQIHLWSL